MTTRTILEIDLKDASFQRFLKTYEQYRQSLQSMPSAWKQVNKYTNATVVSFRGLVAEQVALNVKQKLMLDVQTKADQITKTTADKWRDLVRSARLFTTSVTDATRSILKWGSLTGLIGGLATIAGLWGLGRIAASAGDQRRSALGLGVSPGEQKAFGASFGRVVDPEQFLGGVAEAMTDVTKRFTLYNAGLSEADIGNKNTAQVSALLFQRLKALADATSEDSLGTVFQSRQLDQFLTSDAFRALRRTPRPETEQYQQNFVQNQNRLKQTDEQVKGWQELSVAIGISLERMDTTFKNSLVKLTPDLTSLSSSFGDVVEAFSKSGALKWSIDTLDAGLHKLATSISGGEFDQGTLGVIVGALAGYKVGGIPGAAFGAVVGGFGANAAVTGNWGLGSLPGTLKPGATFDRRWDALGGSDVGMPNAGGKLDSDVGAPNAGGNSWWTTDRSRYAIKYLMDNAGLSELGAKALVSRWAGVESTSGGPWSVNPSSGAVGIEQALGSRKQGIVIGDFKGQLEHAVQELKTTEAAAYAKLRRPKNIEEAAVGASMFERAEGYNSRTGSDAFVAKTINEYARQIGAIDIQVHDNTGGNVNVTANQVGIGVVGL
jgi:hypothetical protein